MQQQSVVVFECRHSSPINRLAPDTSAHAKEKAYVSRRDSYRHHRLAKKGHHLSTRVSNDVKTNDGIRMFMLFYAKIYIVLLLKRVSFIG